MPPWAIVLLWAGLSTATAYRDLHLMGSSGIDRPTDSRGRTAAQASTGADRPTEAGRNSVVHSAAGSARPTASGGGTVADEAVGSARPTAAGGGTVADDAVNSARPTASGGGTVADDAVDSARPLDAAGGAVPSDATGSARTAEAGGGTAPEDATGGAQPKDADGDTAPKDSTGGAPANNGAGSTRSKVPDEYVRVFELLSIPDAQKLQVLARLLQSLYDITTKLEGHLAATGGALHVAVSRMCEADNPLSPPQHRWIRIYDRLGFFSDGDEHACRVVNIGLSYAYRHQELNALTAANALRVRRAAASPLSGGEQIRGCGTGQQQVPEGGVVLGRRPATLRASPPIRGDSSALPPSKANQPTVPASGVNASARPDGHAPFDNGDVGSGVEAGLILPEGGLVVRRHINEDGAGEAVDDDVTAGGIIVATRAPLRQPDTVATGRGPALLGPDNSGSGGDVEVNKVVSSVQPVVTPSASSIKCISAVLEALRERQDIRQVLQQLVIDGLLCLGRLKGGSAFGSASASAATGGEAGWSAVRAILYRWWPI
ncbi:hypothetical protein I4F81_011231 [Pyropia yezoensis]|uniref:Uncharacterized protein n=1 Tax=Pyropia yezoensis TaxID=2788 RepID=A0ACC3CF83_PYRYE|nr:hypothetical protein I4F81_011231 [Neopyropia yezoensis]